MPKPSNDGNGFDEISFGDIQRTSFQDELSRLNKGVMIAWAINFLILALTLEAAFVVLFMATDSSNAEIAHFLLMAALPSIGIAACALVIITDKSSSLILDSTGGELEEQTSGQIFNVVEEMCIAGGIPHDKMPSVFVSHGSGIANAYAISNGKESAVVVTEELASMMDRYELQSVVGHEIGHIIDGDCEAMTKLTALTSMVSIIAGIASRIGGRGSDNDRNSNPIAIVVIVISFIFLLVAPLLSMVAKSYMSRRRESRADAMSVKLTRNPTALARALFTLENNENTMNRDQTEKFIKRSGDVAFYIPSFSEALDTHPPIEDRVRTLVALGADASRLNARPKSAPQMDPYSNSPFAQPNTGYGTQAGQTPTVFDTFENSLRMQTGQPQQSHGQHPQGYQAPANGGYGQGYGRQQVTSAPYQRNGQQPGYGDQPPQARYPQQGRYMGNQ